MNRIAVLIIVFLLTSCSYFEKQKVNSEELLEEELKTFNWNDVDTYPTFDACSSLSGKEESLMCFQNNLLDHVNTFLSNQNIVVSEDVNDTIRLKLLIDKQGSLLIEQIDIKPETVTQIPEIDSLLNQSLKGIPKIYPAIKRGQQVTTAFDLPIIVKIN